MRDFESEYLPRNIQELYNPQLKRDRIARNNFERILANILRRYGHKITKRYNIYNANKNDLVEIVDTLLALDDTSINRNLFNILRGHYPKLAEKVKKRL